MEFILNPDRYVLPDYKISPFTTADPERIRHLPASTDADRYFEVRFNRKPFTYTRNGREALQLALQSYNLRANDLVTILTPTQNFYISSCVTSVVEKFCRWNRLLVKETNLIIVVHEFGFPFTDWATIQHHPAPVIEDCAYSFFSKVDNQYLGHRGDFAVFSFPKMFPIQIGGLLVSNKGPLDGSATCTTPVVTYLKKVLSHHLPHEADIIKKRKQHYQYLSARFESLGLQPRFNVSDNIVPGAFMFKVPDQLNLADLKTHVTAHGIQCSVFYGESAFFIPVHQALTQFDLDYFTVVIQTFLETNTP